MVDVKRAAEPRSLLVISRNAWIDSQSEGNTLSNLFRNYPGEVSHLCCRAAGPENSVAVKHFSMSDIGALRSILKPGGGLGSCDIDSTRDSARTEATIYGHFKKAPFPLFLLAREALWRVARWRSPQLDVFLQKSQPDAVFLSVSDASYVMRIAGWIAQTQGVPLSIFIQDDILMHRGGPIDRIRRLWLERTLRSLAAIATNVFYISEELRYEYQPRLGVKGGRLLQKAVNSTPLVTTDECHADVRFVYVGNLGIGRLDTILAIGEAISAVCPGEASIDVYTGTALSRRERRKIAGNHAVTICGPLAAESVPPTLAQSDVLLHVESLDVDRHPGARLSFSTKLVDYLAMGKCLLAVGHSSMSSIRYLQRNEAAVIIDQNSQMLQVVSRVVRDNRWRGHMAERAASCARANHSNEGLMLTVAGL